MVHVSSIVIAATTIGSFALHAAAQNTTASCGPLQNEVSYSGTNLANIRGVKTPGECCAECGKNPECVTFTWSPNSIYGGYCDLQKTVGATKAQPGSISGARQLVDPTCGPLQTEVAYSGTNLANIRGVKTPGECCAECGKNPECVTFTWSPNSIYGGYCDLQKTVGATKAQPDSISGARKSNANKEKTRACAN